MIYRIYSDDDLHEITALWREALPDSGITEARVIKTILFDPNFSRDGFLVAEENGDVRGFLYAVVRRVPICADAPDESSRGWIAGFAVKKREETDSVGGELVKRAEEWFHTLRKTEISTAFYPQYFTQGPSEETQPEIISLMERSGYSGFTSTSMRLDLQKYVPAPNIEEKRVKLEKDGYRLIALESRYLLPLLDPTAPFSSPSWSYEVKQRVLDLDYARIRIAVKNGKVIGVAPFGEPLSGMMRFGPFGVDPAEQGKGIGSVLLADCLCEMKRRGLPYAWMQSAAQGGSAYHLYLKAGFETWHRYRVFRKTLTESGGGK